MGWDHRLSPGSSPTGLLSAALLRHLLQFFTQLPLAHPYVLCVVHKLLSWGSFAKPTGAALSWAAGFCTSPSLGVSFLRADSVSDLVPGHECCVC